MAITKTGLAVLEGHWGFRDCSMSVAPLIEMALSSHGIAADGYDYERWRTSRHLSEAIARHALTAKAIYLGGHARTSGIEVSRGEFFDLSDIAAAIRTTQARPSSLGLYISMCSIGTPEAATALLSNCPTVEWVAGYAAPVNWGESAAIDMLFFNQWLGQNDRGLRRIEKLSSYMSEWVGHLALSSDVGFNIYTRDGAQIAIGMQA